MFGHDDKQAANLPDPAPDDNLGVTSDPLASTPEDPAVLPSTVTPDPAPSVVEPDPAPVTAPMPPAPVEPAVPAGASGVPSDLLSIKQQALQQLTPLMEHLDQSPEEKFRTTMMMIQAADNQDLIKAAYDAALAIPDEKVRAQALLDVVNEINYFTQNQDGAASAAV